MKSILPKILTIIGIVFSLMLLDSTDSLAQKHKHKHKHKHKENGPPPWAPAHGYRAKQARYYYFRDYPVYYDNNKGVYIFLEKGDWKISARIPSLLHNVNLNSAIKFEIDLDSDKPQHYYSDHKKKYKGKG